MIDLRSDTATRPSQEMYEAMVAAEVGDDMMGEDPTVNRLEAMMMEMCDKPAAVYMCSATQANQAAINSHCNPGQELLIEQGGHITNYEAGAPAFLSGVSCRTLIGESGRLDVHDLENEIHPDDQHFTPTGLICIENTTNLGGGKSYPLEQIDRVGEWAAKKRIPIHLDGARLFNAVVSRGYSPAEMLKNVTSASICFSKGLGCPMGAVLVGPEDFIAKARRARKIFGGAMRQTGILAATAIYGLENNIDKLAVDHANAKLFAKELAKIDGIVLNPDEIETNLVFFDLADESGAHSEGAPEVGTAARLVKELKNRDIGLIAMGKYRLRACTHLDVSESDILTAAQAISEILQSIPQKV